MNQTKIEYETIQIGGALLVRGILQELRVANAIDSALSAQPEIDATYGHLLQTIVVNRLSFDPQPLYRIGDWSAQHGIDHLFGIEAAWLDNDRLGAASESNRRLISLKALCRFDQRGCACRNALPD